MTKRDLTAIEWVERARETLHERTRKEDDTQLIDAHDDLCHALELMGEHRARCDAEDFDTGQCIHAAGHTGTCVDDCGEQIGQ